MPVLSSGALPVTTSSGGVNLSTVQSPPFLPGQHRKQGRAVTNDPPASLLPPAVPYLSNKEVDVGTHSLPVLKKLAEKI